MRYAILGKGFIFPRHVEAIKDTGGEVLLTCDIDPDKKADFTNYRDMFESKAMEDIDAIVICTPNYLHPEMVRDALRTGKKVLCEKPLSINTDFSFMEGVSIVLQLRYHPMLDEICEKFKKAKNARVILKTYRDEKFWASWKGSEAMSGGVVFTLGPHIFDLLVFALGPKYDIISANDSMKKSTGTVKIGDVTVDYHLEFLDSREGQTRHIEIDGEKFILSIKDNLSFEGLHDQVHQAFIDGVSPGIEEVIPSIQLMNDIKKF